jgi:hypothetical protein
MLNSGAFVCKVSPVGGIRSVRLSRGWTLSPLSPATLASTKELKMNGYQKISQHTTNAVQHGTVPAHRTDGYNFRAAAVIQSSAAKFNLGVREIKQATDARREHSRHLSDLHNVELSWTMSFLPA